MRLRCGRPWHAPDGDADDVARGLCMGCAWLTGLVFGRLETGNHPLSCLQCTWHMHPCIRFARRASQLVSNADFSSCGEHGTAGNRAV